MAEEVLLTQACRCYGEHRRHARIFFLLVAESHFTSKTLCGMLMVCSVLCRLLSLRNEARDVPVNK